MKSGAEGRRTAGGSGSPSAAVAPRTALAGAPVVEHESIQVRVEEISYEDLLRYEPLYDRERLPVRFDTDQDADWEYLDYRFYAAYTAGGPVGFSGMAQTRRSPGEGPSSVYHRSSFTLPQYRNRGVWVALWAHKLTEVARLGWATAATEVWGLTRVDDLRYQRRGFSLEGAVVHRYKGEWERFYIWTSPWSRLVRHPANRVPPNGHVLLHV